MSPKATLLFNHLSINYTKSLINALKNDPKTKHIPIVLFSRDPKCDTKTLIDTSADCISLFWNMENFDISLAKNSVAIQGNLNPKVLLESRDTIKKETYSILDKYNGYPGYIFNLGHGITPDIDPNNIKFLTDIVRDY